MINVVEFVNDAMSYYVNVIVNVTVNVHTSWSTYAY